MFTTGKLKPDIHYIRIALDVSSLTSPEDTTPLKVIRPVRYSRGGSATYAEVKAYVLEHTGMKVSTLYIAQLKAKFGLKERENYNHGSGTGRVPTCPKEKEDAITDAFRHFGML